MPLRDTTAADRYDTWFDEPWGRYAFAVEVAAVTSALPPHQDDLRILDAGCGTARFSAALNGDGNGSRSGAAVVGVDRDPSMLAVAARRLPGRCAPRELLARCRPHAVLTQSGEARYLRGCGR